MKTLIILAAVIVTAYSARYTGPTNQAGINLLKQWEGFRSNFYRDPVGIRTIGYGHGCHVFNCNVPLNGKYRVPLTQATGEALLKDDLKNGGYESCVSRYVTYSNLNANQYSALVSFVFNLGCGSLRSSNLLKKLNSGNVNGAADEFGKWINAGGKPLEGLRRRRAAERTLFCSGGACSSTTPKSCTGRTTAALNVRASPSTSARVVKSLSNGATTTITGRSSGTNVSGNPYWFKVSGGYISAYYVNIASNNGASYCKKN